MRTYPKPTGHDIGIRAESAPAAGTGAQEEVTA
jgi:hypothetical protein